MRFFRVYGMSIVLSLAVLYVSIIRTVPEFPDLQFRWMDKVAHFIMYFVLSGVVCFELYRQRYDFSDRQMRLWGLIYPIVYGGVIELLQENFFPPRTGDWSDWVADALGSVAAYFLAKNLLPKYVKPEDQGLSCR
ncbi:MAG: VanZ family protein [Paludibacteraceae bacterium]|jgi:Predicted integral membrane protein|nr:VanZ family protein [Paludibacteraceae bacterium]